MRIDPRVHLAEIIRETPDGELTRVLRGLSPVERRYVSDLWEIYARPKQIWRPTEHTTTLYLAGRGWGKTRTGAEAVHYVAQRPELCGGEIAIVARTSNDLHRTLVHGQSGIMACAEWRRPKYYKADLILEWPTGVTARLYSAEKPAAMRGPNPGFVWGDEIAHWQYDEEMYRQIRLANRGGGKARRIFTTTPLGTPLIAGLAYAKDPKTGELLRDESGAYVPNADTRIIRGSTRENAANLAGGFVEELERDYAGTTTGRQELDGEILLESPHACWRQSWIRRCLPSEVPALVRTMVAVDPSGSSKDPAAEVGIVSAGLAADGTVYILGDLSGHMRPREWASVSVREAREHGAVLGAERNYGGDMVRETLAQVPGAHTLRIVDLEASRSKRDRWSVAAMRYEQGRVVHVSDEHGRPRSPKLETQMTSTNPDKSGLKDRADALAWAVIGLTHEARKRDDASVWTDASLWR